MKNLIIIFLSVIFLSGSFVFAGESNDPKIQEHLGAKIPLQLTFKDESGKDIQLSEIFTKSTVLAFVYYKCPGLCDPLMTEIANVVSKVDLTPGKDYDIVSISFDDNETPADARKKKETFTRLIKTDFPDSAWRFLTGDSAAIKKATDIAGFEFKRVPNGFIHTSVLIFVSKDGKICRYLYPDMNVKKQFGILPFDFKMANMETAEGNEVPVVGKIIQFCFSYDPSSKSYTMNVIRIFGAGIILLAAVFVVFVIVRPQKRNRKKEVQSNG